MDIVSRVYTHPLISEEDVVQIKLKHKRKLLAKNSPILKRGHQAESYLLLEKGIIRSFIKNNDNKEITTGFFGRGNIVIEARSLFQRLPSLENFETITQCAVWEIRFKDFQYLYHNMGGVREWGRDWFSNSLFQMKKQQISMIVDSARTRYNKLCEENPEVVKHAKLKDIASYLGIADSSLSRIRREITKL